MTLARQWTCISPASGEQHNLLSCLQSAWQRGPILTCAALLLQFMQEGPHCFLCLCLWSQCQSSRVALLIVQAWAVESLHCDSQGVPESKPA